MDKWDLSKFSDEEMTFLSAFRQILAEEDAANLGQHVELARSCPHSVAGDFVYLRHPTVYTMIMYGRPGVEALYDVSIPPEGVKSAGASSAAHAALTVALQRCDLVLQYIQPMLAYVDDDVYQSVIRKVESACSDPEVAQAAETNADKDHPF